MASYTYPGVYIEELPSGQHTITGVATSIAAFIGWTNVGPVNEAVMVESWAEYESIFGGLISGIYLGYSVYQFFQNGGTQAYIVRLCDTTSAQTAGATVEGLVLTASNPGAWGNNIAIAISNVSSANNTFNLQVYELTSTGVLSLVESYTNLSTQVGAGSYAPTVVNNDSNYINLTVASPPVNLTLPTATSTVSTVYSINGALSGVKTFDAGEPVSQATSTAKGTVLAVPSASGNLVVALSSGSALPDSTDNWTGGTSGAVFVPTANTSPVLLPLALISGSITEGSGGWFAAGETVTQAQAGGGSSVAIVVNATQGSVSGLAVNGILLVAGINGSQPNSYKPWTGGTSQAVMTPIAAPQTTAAIPIILASTTQAGKDDAQLVPNQSGGAFEIQLLNLQATPPTPPLTGISLLQSVPIFNLLCVPGECSATAVPSLEDFCVKYRAFLIVDSDPNAVVGTGTSGLSAWGPSDVSGDTFITPSSGNAAFYYPWVQAPDPLSGMRPAYFPPCGFVAGIYAATDATRGVWKAPAGIDASLTGALGLANVIDDATNGQLNPLGVNCLRQFPSFGNVVWGARTIAGNDALGSQWKYIPIRRLALYIESSLYQGTQWAVFEPNAEPLWGQVRLSIGNFIQGLFLQGAFGGTTPQQAYFVKCDSDNNPPPQIAQGILTVTVGFQPLYPAEFVVIQIQQMMIQS